MSAYWPTIAGSAAVGAAFAAAFTAAVWYLPHGGVKYVVLAALAGGAVIAAAVAMRNPRWTALWTAIGLIPGWFFARALSSGLIAAEANDLGFFGVYWEAGGWNEFAVVALVAVLLLYQAFADGSLSRIGPFVDLSGPRSGGGPVQSVSGNNNTATLNVVTNAPNYDSEIDEAKSKLEAGDPAAAKLVLNRIRVRHLDELTPRQKYRVLANLGSAEHRLGNNAVAGPLLVEAAEQLPDDIEARGRSALGHLLLGDHETARPLAEEVLERRPTDEVAAHVLVHCAGEDPVRKMIDRLHEGAQTPAVLLAAGRFALSRGELDFAVESLERAGAESSDDPEEVATLATALLGTREPLFQVPHRIVEEDRRVVRRAQSLFDRLIASGGNDGRILAGCHFNRARCREFLDDLDGAAEDMGAAAVHLAEEGDDGNEYAMNAAELLWRADRRQQAVEAMFIRAERYRDPRAAAQLANLVCLELFAGRRQRVLEVVEALLRDETDPHDRAVLLYPAVRLCHCHAVPDRVENLIAAAGDLPDGVAGVVRAEHHCRLGETDEANDAVDSALPFAEELEPPIPGWLADILLRLERPREAFQVYDTFVPRDVPTTEAGRMADAGLQAGFEAEVLAFCGELRSNGVHVPVCREAEVVILAEARCYAEAADAAVTAAEESSDPAFARRMRLLRARLGVAENRADWIESTPDCLPPFSELAGDDLRCLAACYAHPAGPGRLAAVEVLYPLIRQNPNRSDLQKAFVQAMGMGQEAFGLPEPRTVAPGAAFSLRRAGDERMEPVWWSVIEEDDGVPNANQRELPADYPVATAAASKEVGDVLLLGEGGHTVEYRVAEIVSKFVHLFRVICDQWELRFPGEFFVRKFDLIPPGGSEPDVATMLRVMEQGQRRTQSIMRVYDKGPMPLAMLAEILGRPPYEVQAAVAADDDHRILCEGGEPCQRRESAEAAAAAGAVVVGPAAAHTLILLDVPERNMRFPVRLLVPEAALQDLRLTARADSRRGGQSGHAVVRGGRIVYRDYTEEELERYRCGLLEAADWLERVGEVQSGRVVLALGPARRQLAKITSHATTHAVATAREEGLPLWEDDLAVRRVAEQTEGIGTLSTFGMLTLLRRSASEAELAAEFEARLLAMGYGPTLVTDAIIAAAGRLSGWNTRAEPLKGVLRSVAFGWFSGRGVAAGTLATIKALCRAKCPLVGHRDDCARVLLQAVTDHPASEEVLERVADLPDRAFGLWTPFAHEVRAAARRRRRG